MKAAVSNIAWPADQDSAIAAALADVGVSGIEIAPTKVWPEPLKVASAELDTYRRFWESRGISIVAAQALLFARPDLTLFDDAKIRERTFDYLRGIIRVCSRLGAKSLVFGSPKNRLIGNRDRTVAWQEAVDFFGRLGQAADAEGVAVVMEANPPQYGADFVVRAIEALELVLAVNQPGFRLHLDTACMTLANDDPDSIIPQAAGVLAHFHVSQPNLTPLDAGTVAHQRFAAQLAAVGYRGWISLEMRQIDPFEVSSLLAAVRRLMQWYSAVQG